MSTGSSFWKWKNPEIRGRPIFRTFFTYMAYSTISFLGKSSTLSLFFLSFEKGFAIYFKIIGITS